MKKQIQMWAAFNQGGKLLEWAGCRATRKDMIKAVVPGCVSAAEYYAHDERELWVIAHKRGYRVERVAVTPA